MKQPKLPPAPAHLSPEMREFWTSRVRAAEFDPEHVLILTAACEQHDLAANCRKQIAKDGLMLGTAKKGGRRTRHPLLSVASKATETFARLLDKIIPSEDSDATA